MKDRFMIVSEHTLIESHKNTVHSHIVGQLSQVRDRKSIWLDTPYNLYLAEIQPTRPHDIFHSDASHPDYSGHILHTN